MRLRAGRPLVGLLTAAVLVGALSPPAGAVSAWGPQRSIQRWSWSTGSALGLTGAGDLVALVTSDFSAGTFATDRGPYMGVFARTSSDRGVTWSTPVRVSQPQRQADRPALAVSGGAMYAAWVTQRSYDDYDPSKPRILYVRANRGGGWGDTKALTKSTGKVDRPSVAASGTRVYVSWADASTGQVRVATSADGGRSFTRSQVGRTTAVSPAGEGRYGYPSVGATGNVVGVAWIASGSGAVKARVSTNGGRRWQDPIVVAGGLGAANGGSPSVGGWDGKLALAWTTPAGVFARVWSGSWGPMRTIARFGAGGPYAAGFDAQIVPFGGDRLGVVWSACRTALCRTGSATARVDVVWSDSANGGASWSAPSVVQGSVHADQRINEGPSAVWLDAGTPVVGYTGRVAGWTSYDTFLRVGQ